MHRCALAYLDNPTCSYCDTPFKLYSVRTRDHIIPLSRGGKNGYPNKASCCTICNGAKGILLPSEFLAEIEKAYSQKRKFKGIEVELMPAVMRNIKYRFLKAENSKDYLSPTAKKLYVETNV